MRLIVHCNLYTGMGFFSLLHDAFFDWCDLYSGVTYSPKNSNFIFCVLESILACEPAEEALDIHYHLAVAPVLPFHPSVLSYP